MSKKGCFNEECQSFKKQTKYKELFIYCPMCAKKLEYVCGDKTCYNPLFSVRKKFCDDCIEKRVQRNEKNKKALKSAPEVAIKITTAAAALIGLKKTADTMTKK